MTREISALRETVWSYYAHHTRDLPWRQPGSDGHFDIYKILVSEIMLQQTQVSRVIPKYLAWLERFPDVRSLADAPLAAVLTEWSGLGYNRRAKFLHEAAKQLTQKRGRWTFDSLVACKGIGPNTAAAVLVYAYDQPLVFVETNIRTVFIHHFFQGRTDIPDKEILPLVEEAFLGGEGKEQDRSVKDGGEFISPGPMRKTAGLSHVRPREWHWALMDYGSHLKSTVGNASRASRHYARQSVFAGSRRQVRGQVLRLLQAGAVPHHGLAVSIRDERLEQVLQDLVHEGLITEHDGAFRLG